MAMKAKLLVDGEFYNLKEFEYGFITGSDANGYSSGKTRQTGLTCVIEAIRQEYFEEWAMGNFMKKYVEVHISEGVDGMGRTRILKFHDTFLLELHTRFSSTSNEPMSFELYMKSGAIEASWSTAKHVEKWGSLPEEVEPTVIEEELEPRISDFFFEDEKGTVMPQSSLEAGQNVVLVIQTENADGDTLNLNLKDNLLDYKFDGKTAVDDLIEGIVVTGDETRIKLETIKQQY